MKVICLPVVLIYIIYDSFYFTLRGLTLVLVHRAVLRTVLYGGHTVYGASIYRNCIDKT